MGNKLMDYEKDWQKVKDLMDFLPTDEEREKVLRSAIVSHSRL